METPEGQPNPTPPLTPQTPSQNEPGNISAPIVTPRNNKKFLIAGAVVVLMLVVAGSALAAPAVRSYISTTFQAVFPSISNSPSITANIISPAGGEEFYEDSTTTLKFVVAGLPENATEEGFTVQLNLVEDRGSVRLFDQPSQQVDMSDGEIEWHVSPYLVGEYGVERERTYSIELVVSKLEKQDYSAEEIEKAKQYGIDVSRLPPKIGEVPKAKDQHEFKVYRTTNSLLESENGYYKSKGTVELGAANTFDVWGGRFLIRLDSIQNNTAHFTSLFDDIAHITGPVGEFDVPLGKDIKFSIKGTDQFSNGTETNAYTGHIVFNRIFGPNLGEFSITMDTDVPQLVSKSNTPLPQSQTTPVKTTSSSPSIGASLTLDEVKKNLYDARQRGYALYAAKLNTTSFPLGICKKTSGTLFGDDTVYAKIMSAKNGNGEPTCFSTATNFAFSVPIFTLGQSWCADSSGGFKQISGSITGTSCN